MRPKAVRHSSRAASLPEAGISQLHRVCFLPNSRAPMMPASYITIIGTAIANDGLYYGCHWEPQYNRKGQYIRSIKVCD